MKVKIIIVLLFNSFWANSQTYNHTTLWSRLGFQKSIKKFEFRAELDFRQQNDFQKSSLNPIQKPFLSWIRLNTTYNTGKFAHTIIWPTFIKSYPLIGKTSDLLKPSQTEWRTTLNEEFTQPYKKLNSAIRLGYEFRNITTENISRKANRIRLRLSETLEVTKKSSVNSSFEYLWNTKPNIATNPFNQCQIAIRYLHKFGENVNFTTGINHLFRQRANSEEYDSENAILCNFLIILK